MNVQTRGAIRVLIVDEQPVVRFGLRQLLNEDSALQVVGEAGGDKEELEQILDETRPDVVLIDPGSDDLKALERLRSMCGRVPNCRVIIYTTRTDRAKVIVTALELGVSGYLLKEGRLDELLQDIRKVHGGAAVLAPAIADKLVEHFNKAAHPPQRNTVRSLTDRELEVLASLAQGRSNREIAKSLYICEATVKFHVHSILEKLHAGNRTEAVSIAAQRGIIDLRRDPEGSAVGKRF